ncbi:hypothetical protein [Pantoea phage Nafs113]|nr:hypothetical protein [Pantoea phage Nafs113]
MAIPNLVGFIWNGASDRTFSVQAPGMQSLEIDALLSEVPSFKKNVTQYEVEEGKPVTDSVRKMPITLSLECFVSNSPIRSLLDTAASFADGLLGGAQRNQEIYNLLLQLYEYDDEITVYTRYKTFEHMVITDITPARKPEDGDALIFTMELQEIRKAISSTTEVPKGMGVKPDTGKSSATDKATAQRAGVTKNAGQNTGVAGAAGSDSPTLLYQVTQGIKDFKIPGWN